VREKQSARRIGLARALTKLGYCSRSRAADLIRKGRVRLNGKIRRDPEAPVSGQHNEIAVDEQIVERQKTIYLMLNKPRGVITTASDEKGRATVYDLLNKISGKGTDVVADASLWLAPVGRLDKASEGLLLLTNDSDWAARVTAPETHLDKTYHVQVESVANEALIDALVRGVKVKTGEVLRARQAFHLRTGEKNCWLEIILDEGKNRQIRRMIEAMNVEVLRLIRVAIGPLQLGGLAKGEHRELTLEEKRMLDRAMGKRIS
jgi:23S rRNA pseudouridine2605 synthase